MKIKSFWVYLLLRVLFIVLAVVTCWVWIPLACVLWILFNMAEGVIDWVHEVKRDWRRDQCE